MNQSQEIILLLDTYMQKKDIAAKKKATKKKATCEQYVNELLDATLKHLAQQSGKSLKTVKKYSDDVEKALKRTIDPKLEPDKFFAILTNVVKSKLGMAGVSGGRTL